MSKMFSKLLLTSLGWLADRGKPAMVPNKQRSAIRALCAISCFLIIL